VDKGVVCRGRFRNREDVLGIRLNWHKRYITLGPIATVLGLAFKLEDPDRLIGERDELGITVALVPTDLPGVEIGQRHLASYQMFQNGPNYGRDVFIPMDHVLGGEEQVGQGWTMLMSALAAGRGISLPSLSAAGAAFAARTTGAYARVREQFGIPIGKFEGVQERLGRLAATAYQLDAARRLTTAGLDEGRKLAVISAIMKAHATYRLREAIDDAMDVHAGKAVIDGPRNYLANLYRAIPVGITVEGANILTRSLIIFGQGAIRAHPYLLKEMLALEEPDEKRALADFDDAFWRHVGHSTKTLFRALGRSWTGGVFAPAPVGVGDTARHYKQLSRYAASFALTADLVLLTLGGALKRKEMLSARLGDILSELYLLSAALKRFEDEGRREEDRPLLDWCMADGLARIDRSLDAVLANLPSRVAGVLLRAITMPNSRHRRGPSDELTRRCAAILMTPSAARDRLTAGLSLQGRSDGVGHLEDAFLLVTEAEPIMARLKQAGAPNWREAAASGLLTEDEAGHMAALEKAVDEVIAVDDFPPDAFARRAPDRADGNAGADGTARADKNGSADKTASNVEAAE
jgi:acyl-CoA dehydrogenase